MDVKALGLAAFAGGMFVAPALAHHSFAMFDTDKTITLKGTVKEYDWTNPHCYLTVVAVDQTSGKALQFGLEMSSPARQTELGMSRYSVKPGDIVTVTFHPMKDGTRGGQFLQATLANGEPISRGERSTTPALVKPIE